MLTFSTATKLSLYRVGGLSSPLASRSRLGVCRFACFSFTVRHVLRDRHLAGSPRRIDLRIPRPPPDIRFARSFAYLSSFERDRASIFRDIRIWRNHHSTLCLLLIAIALNRSIGPMVRQLDLWARRHHYDPENSAPEQKVWINSKLYPREERRVLSGYTQVQRED